MTRFYKKDGEKWIRVAPDVTNNRPALTYGNDDIRPYWKSAGTGSERLMIEQEFDGSYLIRAINQAEGANSGKETWVHIDKETAARVGAFLKGEAQPPATDAPDRDAPDRDAGQGESAFNEEFPGS